MLGHCQRRRAKHTTRKTRKEKDSFEEEEKELKQDRT